MLINAIRHQKQLGLSRNSVYRGKGDVFCWIRRICASGASDSKNILCQVS